MVRMEKSGHMDGEVHSFDQHKKCVTVVRNLSCYRRMEEQDARELNSSNGGNNKRKRPSLCITSDTYAQDKKMKWDAVNSHNEHRKRSRKEADEEEEEEEEEVSNTREGETLNLYCDSQSLSQSESEFDHGFVAPPSSPRHDDSSQSQSHEQLPLPRSPKRRALTPQNSSANLEGMLKRNNSDVTKHLLSATLEVLATKAKEPQKNKGKRDLNIQ